jgi:hypothetical protein
MRQYSDDETAQAIIDLQKLAGIVEPVDRAIRNAKGFAAWEREATRDAHAMVCGGAFGSEVADHRKAATL